MISYAKDSPLPRAKWLCMLIITAMSALALSGCATDFIGIRTNHAREFPQKLGQKSEKFIQGNESFDLDSCIKIALANNLDIKIADINGQLAGIDRNIAFSYFLPHIDVQIIHLENEEQQMQKAMGSYLVMSDQDITQKVITGQLAVFYPSTWFLYNAYKKGEEIQFLVSERVRQAIRLQVTALYLACLSQEASGKAVVSSVEQAKILVKEMSALYREGLILKSSLEEARVFLAAQQNRLSENNRLRAETKAELMEAMGLSPIVDISLKGIPSLSTNNEEILRQIFEAMINRLELKISDRNVSIMEDAVKITIADFLPKIVLFGDYTNSSNSFQYYESILSYGVSGVLTVFDGFANIQDYKAAKEEHQQAMIEREQSCMKIMLEVIKARDLLDQAKDLQELMSLELDASMSNLKEVQALWREGMVTSSEKLDAVSRYAAAEANVNLADYQYQVAVATMNDVMGLSGKEETSGKTN
ncbi:TolC family protein [Deltaproteobacteria bacterium]|nr:TolC family protein [Deltaproteobacteria bacterium]